MGQTVAAIELLQKAVGLVTPKNSLLYGRLGELIYADGDKETGIEYLTEAVDIDPRNKRALDMMQHALRRRAESQADFMSSDIPIPAPPEEVTSPSRIELKSSSNSSIGSSLDSNQAPLTSSTTRNPIKKRLSVFF